MASPPDISRRNPPEEHQELVTNQRVGSTFDYKNNQSNRTEVPQAKWLPSESNVSSPSQTVEVPSLHHTIEDVGYGNLKEDVISSSDDKKLIDQLTVERDKLQQDVERLRNHLIQIEESYTQEFLLIEEREKQLQQQLNRVERELQEANEQLKLYKSDVIQEQIKSLKTQRDIALTENSQLDDKLQQAKASINNLQLVIEQIQKENETKLRQQQERHDQELALEQQKYEELMKKLKSQEMKFQETIEALGAASRLSETIDIKEQTIGQLKIEVSRKEHEIECLHQEIEDLKLSCEGKVDKQIMKNLVLGYFVTPQDKRHEVERLLARILDFNQEEMAKAKITIGRMRTPSGQESFSHQFVEFLEQESKPAHRRNRSFGPSMEVAKDLSKQLLASTSSQRSNPFLASASPIGKISRSGSKSSSLHSSDDNLNQLTNQLLMGPQLTTFSPLIVSSVQPKSSEEPTTLRPNASSNTLQNVLDFNN